MGVLRSHADDSLVALLPRTLVGRSSVAQLQLDAPGVSSEHAAIYFINGEWRVRDLGSRNGTWVAGERLEAGISRSLRRGDELRFGEKESSFTLLDASPTGPNARTRDGAFLVGTGVSLWLPNEEQSAARVFLDGGRWVLEDLEGTTEVSHGQSIQIDDLELQLVLPEAEAVQSAQGQVSTLTVDEGSPLQLFFDVSQDEEHVELKAKHGHRTVNLGSRAHNYLLLLLARKRRADRDQGISEEESGWSYASDLMQELRLERSAFNVQTWRALQAFKQHGLGGIEVIERRKDAGQLRLGVSEFSIAT